MFPACIIKVVHVCAGNSEHCIDIVCEQRLNNRLAGGHLGHGHFTCVWLGLHCNGMPAASGGSQS